ncbi:unnamed protein product [Leptosia nina]|uniref:Uncharacterized protein n=1 Tax=Leptosia nina TaxID=320188 RepID=A0AAV1JN84_9NEOP
MINCRPIMISTRYKQPGTLQSLSLTRLGTWIALQAELQLNPTAVLAQTNPKEAQATLANKVSIIRNYLEIHIPWMLHDGLAREAIGALSDLLEVTKKSQGFRISMSKFVGQMNVIVKMTEVLFTKYYTYVSIDAVPKMMRPVFYSKLYMLTGLVYLNLGSLSGGWKTAEMESSIVRSLKELHVLKFLFINYDCTDKVLKCIVEHCTNLIKLDVSCSKCIRNESIEIITKLKRLKSIQLYHTFVTWEGFVNLLIHCKSLEDIGRCDEIGRVLEFIHLNCPEALPLNLTIFVSRYANSKHLQLAVEACPNIRNMTVFHNTLQSDLQHLNLLCSLVMSLS